MLLVSSAHNLRGPSLPCIPITLAGLEHLLSPRSVHSASKYQYMVYVQRLGSVRMVHTFSRYDSINSSRATLLRDSVENLQGGYDTRCALRGRPTVYASGDVNIPWLGELEWRFICGVLAYHNGEHCVQTGKSNR